MKDRLNPKCIVIQFGKGLLEESTNGNQRTENRTAHHLQPRVSRQTRKTKGPMGEEDTTRLDQRKPREKERLPQPLRYSTRQNLHTPRRGLPGLHEPGRLTRRVPLPAGRLSHNVPWPTLDNANVLRLRNTRRHKQTPSLLTQARRDRAQHSLRHAHTLRLRPRPSEGRGRGRTMRRLSRLIEGHGNNPRRHTA